MVNTDVGRKTFVTCVQLFNTTMNITSSPDVVVTATPPPSEAVDYSVLIGVAIGAGVILIAIAAGLIALRVLYLR